MILDRVEEYLSQGLEKYGLVEKNVSRHSEERSDVAISLAKHARRVEIASLRSQRRFSDFFNKLNMERTVLR